MPVKVSAHDTHIIMSGAVHARSLRSAAPRAAGAPSHVLVAALSSALVRRLDYVPDAAFHLLSVVGLPLFNENFLYGVPCRLGSISFCLRFCPRFLVLTRTLPCVPREGAGQVLVSVFPVLHEAPALELASWRTSFNPCPSGTAMRSSGSWPAAAATRARKGSEE